MNFDIIVGTCEEFAQALPRPQTNLLDYYADCLSKAENSGVEKLKFQALDISEANSKNFAILGNIQRYILKHMAEHAFPKQVYIVCSNESTAKLYKTVYNFWFAQEKSERLMDENWH